jgi:L-amino acid N-acyltransferase YncA
VETLVIPPEMVAAANREHGLKGRVKRGATREPIIQDGQVVGFYTPHFAANGRMRVGPIYVAPEFRGRGAATSVYTEIQGPMMAAIRDDMPDSIRMHERAGFQKWRRFQWGWYWKRD